MELESGSRTHLPGMTQNCRLQTADPDGRGVTPWSAAQGCTVAALPAFVTHKSHQRGIRPVEPVIECLR